MKKIMQLVAFILAGSIVPAQARIPFETTGQKLNREADMFATKIAAVNGVLLQNSQRKIEAAQKSLPKGKKGYQPPRTTPEELVQRRLRNLGSPGISTLYARQVKANTEKIADKLSAKQDLLPEDLKKDIAVNRKLPVSCPKMPGNDGCERNSFEVPLLYFAAMNSNTSAIHKLLLRDADPKLMPTGLNSKVYQSIQSAKAKIKLGSNLILKTKGTPPQRGEDFISTVQVEATATEDLYKIGIIIQKNNGLTAIKVNGTHQIASQKELERTICEILDNCETNRNTPSASTVQIFIT